MPFDPFKPLPQNSPAASPAAIAATTPLRLSARTSASDAAPVLHWALPTPIGRVGLCWRPGRAGGDGVLTDGVLTDGVLTGGVLTGGVLTKVELAAEGLDAPRPPAPIEAAFAAYFEHADRPIALPAALAGTPFQQRVWRAIAAIPAGSTRTYGALATALGSAPRAVGGACRANPCPLIVPCHRVVGRHGLGGFAGDRDGRLLAIKVWLLRHEQALPAA